MPFKSKSQIRTCYGKSYAVKNGKMVKKAGGWDCEKWMAETKYPNNLPNHKGGTPGSRHKISKNEIEYCSRGYKVCKGPRGGYYIVRKGMKIYLSSIQ